MAYGLRNSHHIAFHHLIKDKLHFYDESNHSTTVNRSLDSSDRRILFLFANAFCSFRTFGWSHSPSSIPDLDIKP